MSDEDVIFPQDEDETAEDFVEDQTNIEEDKDPLDNPMFFFKDEELDETVNVWINKFTTEEGDKVPYLSIQVNKGDKEKRLVSFPIKDFREPLKTAVKQYVESQEDGS